MNKQQKQVIVDELHDLFARSQASFIVNYKGLTVEQIKALRKELRPKGGILKVAKTRLMKRAIGEVDGAQELNPFLKDQIGVVFASDQPPAVAKVLHEFAKNNESLRLIVGRFDAHVFDDRAIILLASLPPKEVLLAQVCGTLKMPMVQLVTVLNVLILRLLWTLKQVAEKKHS